MAITTEQKQSHCATSVLGCLRRTGDIEIGVLVCDVKCTIGLHKIPVSLFNVTWCLKTCECNIGSNVWLVPISVPTTSEVLQVYIATFSQKV